MPSAAAVSEAAVDSAAEEAVLSAADAAELAAVLPQAARETARQPAVKIESAFFMVSSSQIYASLTGIHYAA